VKDSELNEPRSYEPVVAAADLRPAVVQVLIRTAQRLLNAETVHRFARTRAEHADNELAEGVTAREFLAPAHSAVAARASPPPIALWPREPPIRQRLTVPTAWLQLRLREGRNRQARRMTAAVGLPCLRLVRASVGPWTLGALQPGEWRELPRADWEALLEDSR
jgi:pseudouridine synthase